jgi:hypothetical protein
VLQAIALTVSLMWGEVCMQGSGKDKVRGHVTRWHFQNGVETVDAAEYISSLEKEVKRLHQRLDSRAGEVRSPATVALNTCPVQSS